MLPLNQASALVKELSNTSRCSAAGQEDPLSASSMGIEPVPSSCSTSSPAQQAAQSEGETFLEESGCSATGLLGTHEEDGQPARHQQPMPAPLAASSWPIGRHAQLHQSLGASTLQLENSHAVLLECLHIIQNDLHGQLRDLQGMRAGLVAAQTDLARAEDLLAADRAQLVTSTGQPLQGANVSPRSCTRDLLGPLAWPSVRSILLECLA